MASCPAFDPTGPYVSRLVNFVDCHSLALGEEGYRALGPSTGFGMALSGLLTIYVALIGYRLLLGGQMTIREGVFSAIRLGFVLSLTTQWAAYQPLVYDVVTGGPADLASRVLAPGGVGGDAPGQLIARVQGTHAELGELIHRLLPTPDPAAATPATPAAPVPAVAALAPQAPLAAAVAPTGAAAAMVEARAALISADRLLTGAALAGTLSVRVITALLLALGPLFIACLLFDGTRGLFVGWVRVLAGTTLAGLAAALVISLELAVIEPQVQALRDLLDQGQPPGQLPQDMLATCFCFAAIMLAALIALARTTAAFRLPAAVMRNMEQMLAPRDAASASAGRAMSGAHAQAQERGARSRAQQVADAARASERRDAQSGGSAASTVPAIAPRAPAARLQDITLASLPLGQAGRRTAPRMSSAAGRRDTGRREAM